MAIRFELEEHIAAPPDKVSAAIADLDGYASWMPNFVRVERLTTTPFGVGSKFRETRKMFGRESTEEFEVRAYDPGRRIELFVDGTKGTSKKGAFHFVYDLRPEAGGTLLRVDSRIEGLGRLGDFIGRLFAGSFKKAIAKDHAALKKHIESGGV